MFVRKKKNFSGLISVQVIDNSTGKYVVKKTIGSSSNSFEVERLVELGHQWIRDHTGQPEIDFTNYERLAQQVLDQVTEITISGVGLLLGRIFDQIGFNQIDSYLFKPLVLSRLESPSSKLKTTDYLAKYYALQIDVESIYRYMDTLYNTQKEAVQQISYQHTKQILGDEIRMVFYDVTTLYFEIEKEDTLRKTGFSKDGKHQNPQIVLGLLVSANAYPLAYDIFEGNKYEGDTMLPIIDSFRQKYSFETLTIVADSGLISERNIQDLEERGYKYILGARIKNQPRSIEEQIHALDLRDGECQIIWKDPGTALVISFSARRARKDYFNRERGLKRLEKQIISGKLTKSSINKRGYNKYLKLEGEMDISIDREKFDADGKWDGLKGYQTNDKSLSGQQVMDSYRQLWKIEKAFRISKHDLKIRPIYHRVQRRIEAHICLSFAAYKVYKELERQMDAGPRETVGDYRREISYLLYTGMLNVRLDEMTQKAEPPYIFAATNYSKLLARNTYAYQAFANVQPKNIKTALETLVTENERVRQHGFIQSELDRYKSDLLAAYERAYMERNNTESSRYVRDYINNFLEDEPIPGIEFEYNYVKSIIDSITIDEVNALTSRLLSPVNRVIIITAPDKEEIVIPQEPELLDIVKKAEQKELMPYRDKLENAELLEEIPVSGKIIEEETISGTDIDKWTLSNGAVVFLKKTDFKQDEALFSGYSKGGTSLYPMEDYYSATYSDGVFRECGFGNHSSVDLQKLLSGKTASINTYISQNSEGLSGSARPKDLETMFKLAYLKMTAPRRDTEIFASYIAKNKSLYQNLLSNPNYYFLDQSIRFMSQNHPRASGFPKAEEWDKIDLDRATAIYQDRFQNPGDFFFVIVGNFDKTMIRSLVETYIGGIAAQGKNETPKDLGIRPPQGNKQLDVYKGEDDKSSVKIHYHGLYQYDRKTNFHLTALADLLDIRLVEILREEKGGVYGVGASFSGQKFPYEHYRMSISFPCSPNNVDELIKATLNEINDIKENGVSEKNLQKIKEGKLREMEVKIKENNYWLSAIQAYQVYGYEMSEIEAYQSKIEELESEDIRNAALKYLDGENIATLILWPESFEKKP
jgi:predicted Zn-dependent peptidase/transposase